MRRSRSALLRRRSCLISVASCSLSSTTCSASSTRMSYGGIYRVNPLARHANCLRMPPSTVHVERRTVALVDHARGPVAAQSLLPMGARAKVSVGRLAIPPLLTSTWTPVRPEIPYFGAAVVEFQPASYSRHASTRGTPEHGRGREPPSWTVRRAFATGSSPPPLHRRRRPPEAR